ncbi:hypothetical protein PRZ48_000070 [Zasmidium cellare]|uniref:Uncharacterized protein n=1 Tax=Zasmidium cellare TaxID=395010 RepID=A0ABR0EZ50_ZASCE|nr:hypothetical protein PRZ48_000070 [Zasmidium cellare]
MATHQQDNGQSPQENRPRQPWRSRRVAEKQQAGVDAEAEKENAPPVDNATADDSIAGSRTPLGDITDQVSNLNLNRVSQRRPQNNARADFISSSSIPDPLPQFPSESSTQPEVEDDGFTVVQTRAEKRAAKRRQPTVVQPTNNPRAPQPNAAPRQPSTFPSGPRTKIHGILHSEQRPGMIFRHLDIRPCTNPNAKLSDPGVSMGPDGKLWMKKWRNWGVVAQHGETVTECPIYTHNDNGLANKPHELRGEYLSLMPFGVFDEEAFVNQSPGNPVLKIGTEFSRDLTRSTMVFRYTELQTRSMECDELAKVAELDGESTEILRRYAARAMLGFVDGE